MNIPGCLPNRETPSSLRKFLLSFLIAAGFGTAAYSDQGQDWIVRIRKLESLERKDRNAEMSMRDLSPLWISGDRIALGYLGEDYQRLRIRFETVRKTRGRTYGVKGRTRASTDACTVKGTLTLENTFDFTAPADECGEGLVFRSGVIMGSYRLTESACGSPGTFEGVFSTFYYYDKGAVQYDDLATCADGWANNSFVGTWKSNRTGKVETANWGHGRIPFSAALDNGASEFYPAESYRDKGWESFSLFQQAATDSAKAFHGKDNLP